MQSSQALGEAGAESGEGESWVKVQGGQSQAMHHHAACLATMVPAQVRQLLNTTRCCALIPASPHALAQVHCEPAGAVDGEGQGRTHGVPLLRCAWG